jgi:hypothetical protein
LNANNAKILYQPVNETTFRVLSITANIHKEIAEKIGAELNLSEAKLELLTMGSIGPDSWGNFPHQIGKNRQILYKIDTARTLYLENDEDCYSELGNALHYIQDKWVLPTQTTDDPVQIESDNHNATIIVDDEIFMESLNSKVIPANAKTHYLQTVTLLATIKNSGIESWFDHSWGIWHKDYSSCIFAFTDALEIILPQIYPEHSTNYLEGLKNFTESQKFKDTVEIAFHDSVVCNFLTPKLQGYPAAMYSLASIEKTPKFRSKSLDLNIAYRLSLEIARYTLSSAELFKFIDSWTQRNKEKPNTQQPLTNVQPEYHTLISKPVKEVLAERSEQFEAQEKKFLSDWTLIEKSLPLVQNKSAVWKILIGALVGLISTKFELNEQ